MDIKRLIDLIELKDRYAIALMDHYINKGVNTKDLQKYTDSICNDWARTFIALYHNEFNNRETEVAIFRYLDSIGVRQGHTGKRFSEALYKRLSGFAREKDSQTTNELTI